MSAPYNSTTGNTNTTGQPTQQNPNQGYRDDFSGPNRNNEGYTGTNTAGHHHHHHQNNQNNQGYRDDFSDPNRNAPGHNAGFGHGHNMGTTGVTGPTGTGANTNDPTFNNTNTAGGAPLGANNQYPPSTGTNTAGYPGTTGAGNTTGGTGGGPTGKVITGKLQQAAGTLLSSETMKAKGLAKEQEGQGQRAQGQHLSHAQRLEAEAGDRRNAAVAHDAHPHHGKLGGVGHNTGPGLTQGGANAGGVNQPQVGTNAAYGPGGAMPPGNNPTVGGGAFGLQ